MSMFRRSSLIALAFSLSALGSATVPAAAGTTIAQPRPSVGNTCAADKIPALGAAIDELLPKAQLSPADAAKVGEMRELIRDLAANGKEGPAREIEEAAMRILGYDKLWLRCGYGTFRWLKQVSATQPAQPE
jgi:hypothetical protein